MHLEPNGSGKHMYHSTRTTFTLAEYDYTKTTQLPLRIKSIWVVKYSIQSAASWSAAPIIYATAKGSATVLYPLKTIQVL